jgi:adenylosuccinate synthase
MSVCAVVGAQFGSEGKGLIVGKLAPSYQHHVRVGAANAGHTVYDNDGQKRVLQQIPCAAYMNPFAQLWIGPGALISPDIFEKELDDLQRWRSLKGFGDIVINVDARAHVIRQEHVDIEQLSGLAERIGSTSTIAREGIGAAQAARVMREAGCITAQDFFEALGFWGGAIKLRDVPVALYDLDRGGAHILLEGTQGTSLSLTTGAFPFVTSRNTTAAGLAADCGVAPGRVSRVVIVARTYPIRVAGNSGHFWHDGDEITWEEIGVDPDTERTTVTKKVRRVGLFSYAQMQEAFVLNGPTEVALTFCDYTVPELRDREDMPVGALDGLLELQRLIGNIERHGGVPVTMLGTGPSTIIRRKRWRSRCTSTP